MSTRVYVLTGVCFALGIVLADATDGWSWLLWSVAGALAVADGWTSFRAASRTTPKRADEVEPPLNALAATVGGTAFAVAGVLAAAGVIDLA